MITAQNNEDVKPSHSSIPKYLKENLIKTIDELNPLLDELAQKIDVPYYWQYSFKTQVISNIITEKLKKHL